MIAIEPTTSVEEAVAARSRLYRLLADGFCYPEQDFFTVLKSGRYRDEVVATCRPLPYNLTPAFDGLVASGRYLDFQAEYLRLFEVGLGVPPCPLYGGLYRGGRKAVMEELVRFYGFFGLSIERGAGELPDHLITELEFLHFLTFKELAARRRGDDVDPYRCAQADFLERQLLSWLPALERRLVALEPPSLYVALVWLVSGFARGELAALRASADLGEEDQP